MKQLQISKTLSLPTDAVTQKLAFIGRTGSGKSYGATKLAELFHSIGAQFIAIDPVGIWYGLRIPVNNQSKGIDIPVFGGLHGDISLDSNSGSLIADLVADRNISVIIDVSQFEFDTQKAKFVNDFASRFFYRKKALPSPVHLFLEECDEFIPQEKQKGEEKMIHAIKRIAKQGRNFGIGLSLISQRPQAINKNALNQTECLFAFQMTGSHERRAMKEWIDAKALNSDIAQILPRLKQGHTHVYSPVWLEADEEIFIAAKETYSPGTTPKFGERVKAAKPLAPVEIEQLKTAMAATVEKAKENDPKELQKQIAVLKAEKAKLLSAKPSVAPVKDDKAIERAINQAQQQWDKKNKSIKQSLEQAMKFLIEITTKNFDASVPTDEIRKAIEAAVNTATSKMETSWLTKTKEFTALRRQAQLIISKMKDIVENDIPVAVEVIHNKPFSVSPARKTPSEKSTASVPSNSEIGNSGLRRILTALYQYPDGLSAKQVGIIAGLKASSGTFTSYASRGKSSGWMEGSPQHYKITQEGIDALGEVTPLPTGEDLFNYWMREFGDSGASRILEAVYRAYPNSIDRAQVGEQAGISHTSGTFTSYLSRLKAYNLIEGKSELKASPSLFQ